MILVFDYNGYWSDLVYVLQKVGLKIFVLQQITPTVLNHLDEKDIILPIGIKSQIELNKYSKYKEKFLINKEKIYEILDDKILFYNFISQEKILDNSVIKLIPTYNNYTGYNMIKKVLLKERNQCAAKGHIIKNNYINEIVDEYKITHQIQDIINIKKVYSISFLCYKGLLIKSLNFIKHGNIENSHINSNVDLIIKDTKKVFTDVIQNIVKKLKLSGIHEIEFIKDKNGTIYLMEFNPRIAGTLKCFCNNESPFVNELIISYCNIISNEDLVKNNVSKLYGTYLGKLNKKYEVCKCGIVTLD